MRTVAFLAALLAAVVVTAAAAAPAPPTTTLAASKTQVGYGKTVKLAGRVSNGAAGVAVAISARPFDRARLARVATVRSGTSGHWTYAAKPAIATTYVASVGAKSSPSVLVDVRPALALGVAATGAVVAHVGPALTGRFVQLQQLTSPGKWTTIAKRRLGKNGTAAFTAAKLPNGKTQLRLVMSVNQAGGGFLGGFSAPFVYSTPAVSLAKTPLQVGYGRSLDLSGRVSPAKAGVPLQILARPFMQQAFQQVATVRTTTGGKWQYRVTPPFTTSYAARWGNGETRVLTIGVRPAMNVHLLSGDRIWAHVGLAKAVKGRTLELQQKQPNGSWKTIDSAKLDAKASAVFPLSILPAGSSTLRTAISVNQVGAGFLGGFSRSFVYHR